MFVFFWGFEDVFESKSGNFLSRTSELHGRFHISWSDLLISDGPGGAVAQAGERKVDVEIASEFAEVGKNDMGVEPKKGGTPPKWIVYNGKPY